MILSDRKKLILKSIIDEFVGSTVPVASRVLCRKYSIDVSPATVRNEMAELEHMGLLSKCHSYSGRVPSDSGYRFFVDNLLEERILSGEEMSRINRIAELTALREMRERLVQQVCQFGLRVIQELSGEVAFLAKENREKVRITTVRVVRIAEHIYTVFFQDKNGVIDSKVWVTEDDKTDSDVNRINNILKEFSGCDADNISERVELFFGNNSSLISFRDDIVSIVDLVTDSSRDSNIDNNFYFEGMKNLINKPEFESIDKIRAVVELFENKKILVDELRRLMTLKKMSIRIGEEFENSELNDLSMIGIPYFINSDENGVIGIIGPKRMDYEKVICIVRNTAERMSALLSKIELV